MKLSIKEVTNMKQEISGIIELSINKHDVKKFNKLNEEYKHHMQKATLLKNKIARMNLRIHQISNR